jgi:tetratricopeptide (TPR) repeat protein
MRTALRVASIAVPVLVAAAAVVALRPQRQWTSESADAIAELRRGLQAEMKLYRAEGAACYERALVLDPHFTAAKIMLINTFQVKDKQRVMQLLGEVRAADLERLSAGERVLVRHSLARVDRRHDEAARVLDAHLAENPIDAFALHLRCTDLWDKPDWDAAESCNRELLRVDPNWVLAYNHLGYIAMAQGRFDEAEKSFLAYKYIAPEQANPRDSLGELYTLLGRYEEAAAELDEALRLRPDFCLSYRHLLLVAELRGDFAAADAVAASAAAGGCDAYFVEALRCSAALWQRTLAHDWEGAWAVVRGDCRDRLGDEAVLAHRAATQCGRLAEAAEFERRPVKGGKMNEAAASGKKTRSSGAAHMEGARLLAQGDAAGAVACFDEADRGMVFAGEGQGVFKLLNQLALAEALHAAGLAERSAAVQAAVAAVNPRIGELFAEPAGR